MVGNIANTGGEHPPMKQTRDAYGLCHTSGSARNDVCRKTYQMTSAGLPSTMPQGVSHGQPAGNAYYPKVVHIICTDIWFNLHRSLWRRTAERVSLVGVERGQT